MDKSSNIFQSFGQNSWNCSRKLEENGIPFDDEQTEKEKESHGLTLICGFPGMVYLISEWATTISW